MYFYSFHTTHYFLYRQALVDYNLPDMDLLHVFRYHWYKNEDYCLVPSITLKKP